MIPCYTYCRMDIMETLEKPLEELVKELPPHMRDEVRDFVEFLISKHFRVPGKKLSQTWAGSLEAYKRQYSSVDLQHKAMEWRK